MGECFANDFFLQCSRLHFGGTWTIKPAPFSPLSDINLSLHKYYSPKQVNTYKLPFSHWTILVHSILPLSGCPGFVHVVPPGQLNMHTFPPFPDGQLNLLR